MFTHLYFSFVHSMGKFIYRRILLYFCQSQKRTNTYDAISGIYEYNIKNIKFIIYFFPHI